MKAALFLAAAGLAVAQDLSGQPECALKCLKENIPKAGCELTDTACQCEPSFQSKLAPIITPCLTEACQVDDLLKAQKAAVDACKAYAATAGAGSTTVAPTESLGSVTVSIDTSITGSASVPAIFSSIPEEKPIPPVTPRPGNGTMTKTMTEGGGSGGGAVTPTGTSGGGGSGGASSVPTDAGAGAVAGPAMGLLAIIAAAIAL
ncbi:cell wall [Fusarium sporotrichioides]|uniref:Cell wall n=1 Tax=Fusarium sporotrichioides TaxID=5514 RepID=A0A395S816_FUSSP|nr:cell wall [Fusarium sporotrichioides]